MLEMDFSAVNGNVAVSLLDHFPDPPGPIHIASNFASSAHPYFVRSAPGTGGEFGCNRAKKDTPHPLPPLSALGIKLCR